MKRRTTIPIVFVLAGIGSVIALPFSQSASEVPKSVSMASISGVVRDDAGKPIRGATVTATSGVKSVSRFTDQSGRYRIPGLKPGQYVVSATAWGFSRNQSTKEISEDTEITFRIGPDWDVDKITTADWLSFLPEDKDVLALEATCVSCHNLNRPAAKRGRIAQEWKDVIFTMSSSSYIPHLPKGQLEHTTAVLEKYFGPNSPAPAREQLRPPMITDAALQATFREYLIPTARSFALAMTVDSGGTAWFTETGFFANRIGRFNINTETFQEYPIPTPRAGPHNAVVSQDGRVWVTMRGSNQLSVLDRQTGKFTEYKPPTPGLPHIPAVDSSGNIWFTDNGGANKIVKFDPRLEKFQEYRYPVPKTYPKESILAFQAVPGDPIPEDSIVRTYDIAIDSHDKVWFTYFALGKMARFDPTTEKFTEYAVPGISSLRGLAIDSQGNIWFANHFGHKLGKMNPNTGKIQQFQPPTRHANPYGVLVAKDGYVWFTDLAGNHITSFNPKTEEFVEYPIPTHDALSRFMGEDRSGRIWFTEFFAGKIGSIEPGRGAGSSAKASEAPANVFASKAVH